MEFDLKDYETARGYADRINVSANSIMAIFDEIDATMNRLYGSDWSSSGADNAKARYDDIRKNYDSFYQRVVDMKAHVYKVTRTDQAADAAASSAISNPE